MAEQTVRSRTRQSRIPNTPPRTITQLLRCPKCNHAQFEYTYKLTDKPWLKCEGCQELSASGAWLIIAVHN